MKKLISLIGAGLLFFGGNAIAQEVSKLISQEEIFSKLGIPEKFVGYREKSWSSESTGIYDNKTIYFVNYDLDDDGRADVTEVRDNPNEYPSEIGFDINGNYFFEEEEIWLDSKKDNWNGNETSFYTAKMGADGCKL